MASISRWEEPWGAAAPSTSRADRLPAAPTFSWELGRWGQGTALNSHTSCRTGGCPGGLWGVMSAPVREEAWCRGEGPWQAPKDTRRLRRRPRLHRLEESPAGPPGEPGRPRLRGTVALALLKLSARARGSVGAGLPRGHRALPGPRRPRGPRSHCSPDPF